MIETARLVLRDFVEGDWRAMLAIHSQPEVVRWLMFDVMDEAGARAYVQRILDGVHEQSVVEFAVTLPGSETLIGRTGFRRGEDPRIAELWFTFDPAHQGKGYAVEAARALLGYAFETLGLHRVWGDCDPRNPASAAVMRKLGMRSEGHLVQNVFIKGEWCDSLVFAMLSEEWFR